MSRTLKKRGLNLTVMYKLQRISDLQHEFSFLSTQENFCLYFHQFLQSDLGIIPWDSLVLDFKIKEYSKGTKNFFSSKGILALMFLKH
tara:strand:- start:102 stop:365 length:264 start_codon:yes stop_codon:yes gene_type:complete